MAGYFLREYTIWPELATCRALVRALMKPLWCAGFERAGASAGFLVNR